MKKFFSTATKYGSRNIKDYRQRPQLEINIEYSRKRAIEALKKINELPIDQQPKSVDPKDLKELMDEANELRKDSVY